MIAFEIEIERISLELSVYYLMDTYARSQLLSVRRRSAFGRHDSPPLLSPSRIELRTLFEEPIKIGKEL